MSLEKTSVATIILYLAVITSVFSQMEPVQMIMRPVMYLCWAFLLVFLFCSAHLRIRLSFATKLFLALYFGLLIVSLVQYIFRAEYMLGNYPRIMMVPLLVSICAEQYSEPAKMKDLQSAVKLYIVCSLIYALWVNITFFPSYGAWLSQKSYAFVTKNSAAQLWAISILFLFFFVEYKSKREKTMGMVFAAYFLLLIGLSQCRTALLALGMVTVAVIFVSSEHKARWVALSIVLLIFAWRFPPIRAFIDKTLLITKYAGTDLNTFSSGRIGKWIKALKVFAGSPLLGSGKYYVDCSYILILAETGIIGFLLIEPIWIYRIFQNLRCRVNKKHATLLLSMTVFYLVESLLEGYPPFGPGVTSFMFWFVSIVLVNNGRRENELKERKLVSRALTSSEG